jgi:hypothetical protein
MIEAILSIKDLKNEEWVVSGSCEFVTLPRVGEYIEIQKVEDDAHVTCLYRVLAVIHPAAQSASMQLKWGIKRQC